MSDVIPNDRAVQVDSLYYLRRVGRDLPAGAVVVDLGCGIGSTANKLRNINDSLFWIGVDIESSPEVDARSSDNAHSFVTFDGVNLPFADSSIACVYSHQALEHVRHPELLLLEVSRVLAPGAFFIGSTSNLEPYHSLSYWNFTPFGFRSLVEGVGLALTEIRPGIDGPTIIERQIRGRPPEFSRFFVETSPLNDEIIRWGTSSRRRPALINNRMLQFCGQFAFLAERTDEQLPRHRDGWAKNRSNSRAAETTETSDSSRTTMKVAQERGARSLLHRFGARVRPSQKPSLVPAPSPSEGGGDIDFDMLRRGWEVRREFDLLMPSADGAPHDRLRIACPKVLYIPKVLEQEGLRAYEAETLAVALALSAQMPPDRWFFDIGANVGVFSWLVASAVGRTVAFEPTPDIARTCVAIATDNDLDIEVEETALGDAVGEARLYLSNTTDASNSLNQAFRGVDEFVDVTTTTVDAYVSTSERVPGLLKIDTESTEPAVLRGAITTLGNHRMPIICEVLRDTIGEQIVDIIDHLDYTYYPLGEEVLLRSSSTIRSHTDSHHRNWLLSPSALDASIIKDISIWRTALERCGPNPGSEAPSLSRT